MLLLALTLTLGAGTAIAGGLGIGGAPVARAATSGTCDSSSDTCGSYHYRSSGGGCADGYVNQNNYNNVWVTFGSACTTDGAAEITLADDGGDSYPKQVGADAIRAVPTSYLWLNPADASEPQRHPRRHRPVPDAEIEHLVLRDTRRRNQPGPNQDLNGPAGMSLRRSRVQLSRVSAAGGGGVTVTVLGWALTVGLILALFALDLAVATVRPHAVGYREATGWSVFYVGVAVAFGLIFARLAGWRYGSEYFAGYIVEKSLSVDNLFVFVIIMTTFAVPGQYQQRVLLMGILGALSVRAVFIALGATLLSLLSFMFLVFGLLLLWTAVRLYHHRAEDPDIQNNPLVRASRKILPVSDSYADGKMVVRAGGHRLVTPLFIVFIAIGGTDILFALDSIPAVFGVTNQPYIVFVANAFALLGLRALFFLVTGLLDRLVYLATGLALILGFIGIKLILHWSHTLDARVPQITTPVSLIFIAAVLAITTGASLIKVHRDPSAKAHTGTVIGTPKTARKGISPSDHDEP